MVPCLGHQDTYSPLLPLASQLLVSQPLLQNPDQTVGRSPRSVGPGEIATCVSGGPTHEEVYPRTRAPTDGVLLLVPSCHCVGRRDGGEDRREGGVARRGGGEGRRDGGEGRRDGGEGRRDGAWERHQVRTQIYRPRVPHMGLVRSPYSEVLGILRSRILCRHTVLWDIQGVPVPTARTARMSSLDEPYRLDQLVDKRFPLVRSM